MSEREQLLLDELKKINFMLNNVKMGVVAINEYNRFDYTFDIAASELLNIINEVSKEIESKLF
jgi:hypothetical protein